MNLSAKKILFLILVFSFAVRIFGIDYGLPLQVVADEPPFILGAIKMIELKTIIPLTHMDEFQSILYYPPFISYTYLPFFVTSLGIDYLLYDGDQESFTNYVGSDLSDFFLIARFITVLLGVFSVWLVYKAAKNIFEDENIALWSAFFMSTDLLHIMLSMTSRQWIAVQFIFLSVLYFLTKRSISLEKRYIFASITAGVGIGISIISFVSALLIALYFLFIDKLSLRELFRKKFFYICIGIFILLSYLPFAIYPSSIGFGGKVSIFQSKNLLDLLASPIIFLKNYLLTHPVVLISFLLGLVALFKSLRSFFYTSFIFICSYSAIYYLFFRFEDRFIAPLVPIIAIISGYGITATWGIISKYKFSYSILAVLLIFQLSASAKLGYLAFRNDSRQNMRAFAEGNLPEDSKVITKARLMRLSSNKSGIDEQTAIDPGSIRQVERSEKYFGRNPNYRSFHVLNLDFIGNEFERDILEYSKNNSYKYLILDDNYLLQNGSLNLIEFGENSRISIADTRLSSNPLDIFRFKMLGPRVRLYQLQ